MKLKLICKIIVTLFLVYLIVGLFALYAGRTVQDTIIPERPFIHPFLVKIAMVLIVILVGPTLLILFPILKLMGIETTYRTGTIVIYFFTSIIWILYFLILRLIYLFTKKFYLFLIK